MAEPGTKPPVERDDNGRFSKGNNGGMGRPKNGDNPLERLLAAVKIVEKKKRKKVLEHFIEEAYEDNTVLIALMKKIVPDISRAEIEAGGRFEVSWVTVKPES